MKKYFVGLFIMLVLFIGVSCTDSLVKSDSRGVGGTAALQNNSNSQPPEISPQLIQVSLANGKTILSSYTGSYALLIGESDYSNGWPDLNNIPRELVKVESILKAQGFKVEKSLNLNSSQLEARFKKFINDYGYKPNNRLLFFYSGHGHTDNGQGFLVPTDAPNPDTDIEGFLQKSLVMSDITAMARKMRAKHVLFLFDSCFSGSVFQAKERPKVPRQITKLANKPVRQFITAGSENETVPAKSVFTPAFVDALEYGLGDLTRDGYITGQELGLYLQSKVPQHTDQTPQYGKIRDYDLSLGDFVFVVGANAVAKPKPQKNQQVAQVSTNTGQDAEIERLKSEKAEAEAEAIRVEAQVERERKARLEAEKRRAEKQAEIERLKREAEEAKAQAERERQARIVAEQQARLAAASTTVPVQPIVVTPKSKAKRKSKHKRKSKLLRKVFRVSKVFRDTLSDGSQGPEMVWIPAGSFRMGDIQGGGDNDEKPVHRVSVDRFAMGKYEVTFAEYDKFAQATGRSKPDDESWGRGNRPVINVSWNDATAYTKWLSQQTGHTYRLPTEAEWEYAARAGTETKYWWGNDIGTNKANCRKSYCGDSFKYTAPVGSFRANQFGLYDTVGNVWEWVSDIYRKDYYSSSPRSNPKGPSTGRARVLRGGAWVNDGYARYARAANRFDFTPANRFVDLGFRLVRTP